MSTFNNEYTLKNNQTLTVRSPRPEDAQGIIDYLKTVDCETRFLAREPGEFSLTIDQEREFIMGLSTNPLTQMMLAEIDGEIVANCSIGLVNKYSRFKHRATLGIAVKQAFWRLGIGEILLSECIVWSRKTGVEQIELDVVSTNTRAKALYEKLGFEVYGTKKNAIKYGDGTYADEYFMILTL